MASKRKPRTGEETCRCDLYAFPHRKVRECEPNYSFTSSGGHCYASEAEAWSEWDRDLAADARAANRRWH